MMSFMEPMPKYWGYYVSTVGKDEEMIKAYIRNQETEDQKLDQLRLFV